MYNVMLAALAVLSLYSFSLYADDFELVDKDNIAMNKAYQKAKAGLDKFLKIVEERPKHLAGFSVYLKFEDNGKVEYLWLVDVKKYDNEYYMGAVESKPRLVTNVAQGKTLGFKKSDIYDWEYFDKKAKKTYGAFTTCALLKKDSKEDQQYIKDRGLQCKL